MAYAVSAASAASAETTEKTANKWFHASSVLLTSVCSITFSSVFSFYYIFSRGYSNANSSIFQ